jgi:hypothetical protein
MSGCSYDTSCPNCNNTINAYSDYKPYDYISLGPCLECGWQAYTQSSYITLKRINEERDQRNLDQGFEKEDEDYLHPIKKLPKRIKHI